MKIITRQSYKWMQREIKNVTYQTPFPEILQCGKCKTNSILMMLIDDDEGLIAFQRKILKPKGVWPHDCMAIALYFCPKCGKISTKWNQG